MVTRKNVALQAGVSEATVSHVVNKSKYVSHELSKKVLEAIEQLDYHPNLIARSLMTKTTDHVVILVDDIKNPYFGEITEGMGEVASKEGYIVSLISAKSSNKKAFMDLVSRNIDGIFFTNTSNNFSDIVDLFKQAGIALVCAKDSSAVILDYNQAMDTVIKYLSDLGHKKIGFLSGLSIGTGEDRYKAYVQALENHGIPLDPDIVIDGSFPYTTEYDDGYKAMKKILNQETRVTAVFAVNDMMALGAVKAIREEGLKIPEDISVVGCDDIFFAESADPPLSTIRTPKKEIGRRAMYLLLDQIRGKKPENVVLSTEFIIRRSTGPAKS
jgi:DNA-binding LacI/PurR family transcriptional regulator